jgi:NADH-quinone oxidoreductase subunit A
MPPKEKALSLLAAETAPYWPLALYFAAVVVTVGGIVATSYVLGERHRERATGVPYESGMVPTGSARLRFSADFYLVVMFFVIFDLESVFVFAWAVAARKLGWTGYAAALTFMGTLLAALVYLWRVGALDWGPGGGRGIAGGEAPGAGPNTRSRQNPLPNSHCPLPIEKEQRPT